MMTVEQARATAAALTQAADAAEAAGRTELLESDLDALDASLGAALDKFQADIDKAG